MCTFAVDVGGDPVHERRPCSGPRLRQLVYGKARRLVVVDRGQVKHHPEADFDDQ